ncbi:Macrolide export ATP-binding/permease protein macB [Syntrophobacter sp. SbD1]|nr:Macrolide export ATP-binding/permease protein macB [Syntrophobacter sp. SbD1]
MRLYFTLKMALNALRHNVMRAALTTLGIIIGVAAVITMMEIGKGASLAIQRAMASIGANTVVVLPGSTNIAGVATGSGSKVTLTPQDADAILKECPSIDWVAPVVRARVQVVYNNQNWVPAYVYGTTPRFLDIRDWTEMQEGEAFTEHDVLNSSKVCIIGQTVVKELFGGESPVGKHVRIRNVDFRVIGVLKRKGANLMGLDQDDILLAPWTTLKYRVVASTLSGGNQSSANSANTAETSTLSMIYPYLQQNLYYTQTTMEQLDAAPPIRFTNVDQILTSAHSGDIVSSAIQDVGALLRQRHRLRDSDPDDFYVRDMTELTKTMASTSELMTKLLLSVAMISLLVGGIGIMNIMLVSVTERTREIGLRMAVGAEPNDILRQFLAEAVVLCLLGGTIGILLGRGSSYVISLVLRWPTAISIEAIVAAVLVSATVGIAFGFYPAYKASKLDPIEALRYE